MKQGVGSPFELGRKAKQNLCLSQCSTRTFRQHEGKEGRRGKMPEEDELCRGRE